MLISVSAQYDLKLFKKFLSLNNLLKAAKNIYWYTSFVNHYTKDTQVKKGIRPLELGVTSVRRCALHQHTYAKTAIFTAVR